LDLILPPRRTARPCYPVHRDQARCAGTQVPWSGALNAPCALVRCTRYTRCPGEVHQIHQVPWPGELVRCTFRNPGGSLAGRCAAGRPCSEEGRKNRQNMGAAAAAWCFLGLSLVAITVASSPASPPPPRAGSGSLAPTSAPSSSRPVPPSGQSPAPRGRGRCRPRR